MIIYTSYYSNKKIPERLTKIGISRYLPDWFDGPSYKALAPTSQMLHMSNEEYDYHFKKILSRLDPKTVVTDLHHLAMGGEFVLLCYEKPPEKCHRATVAEWLRSHNYKVKECYFKGAEELTIPEAIGRDKAQKRQTGLF